MSTVPIIELAAIAVLLVLSGFFSGSETALTAASKVRLHQMAKDGSRRARFVEGLIDDRERLIGGILLGNNLVNILASALATSIFIGLVGEEGVVYATLVMTALVLIFAEVLPKTYAISNADRMALTVGPIIGVFVRLFAPVVHIVRIIVRATLRVFGVDVSDEQKILTAHEEILGTISLQEKEGGIVKADRVMLGNILNLDQVFVEDVMVHRKSMLMIDIDDRPADIISQVMRAPFTRIPLWQDDPENIIGVLHVKDVLRAVRRPDRDISTLNFRRLMSKAWFVPETTTLREQLNAFLERRAHFALVVDEYGALMGLVTLEDILEEIVGEIDDEYDTQFEGVRPQEDGSLIVDGTVAIRDLNRRFDWRLPDDEATTIAGLVIDAAETIPIVGQSYSFHGFDFEILGRKRNQITQLKMRRVKAG
ncbi:MAG: HlyC/CorC family transporter [Sphingomonadales bacterium]|nr:HlyC/CorC family transporter [Sphingomonadales bacterium]